MGPSAHGVPGIGDLLDQMMKQDLIAVGKVAEQVEEPWESEQAPQ